MDQLHVLIVLEVRSQRALENIVERARQVGFNPKPYIQVQDVKNALRVFIRTLQASLFARVYNGN